MALIIRFLAFAGVWSLSRMRRSTSPAVVAEIERLSWANKARLVWALSRDARVPLWPRLIVLAPALYLVSPIDILPDFIPILGRLDDAAIFGLSMDLLARFAPADVIHEHLDRLDPGRARARPRA